MSTDELTGVQALERKHPGLPLAPGKVERREFEYIRHGTRSFIISRDVVTGQIVEPYGGPRRTEADFLQHVEAVIACDRAAHRWHFVVDNLDTHRSESLVRWVARESGLDLDRHIGAEILEDYTPKSHGSGNLAEHSGARVIQSETEGVARTMAKGWPRPGAPARITPEQVCQIMSLACEAPSHCGRFSQIMSLATYQPVDQPGIG